jgi:hypothetical protein
MANTVTDLRSFLIDKLREQLAIPVKYTDELIALNLPYLFAADEHSALRWAAYLEACFQITIPDEDVDMFFFSDLGIMQKTIEACIENTYPVIPVSHET